MGAGKVDTARGKVVTAVDSLMAGNFNKSDRLGVAGFEADRGSGSDVEAVAVCLYAVEVELGVCFDKVIV